MEHCMKFFRIFKRTASGFSKNNISYLSSAIAFYLILSLPAMLIVIIAVAGSIYDNEVVIDTLLANIANLVGKDSADVIARVLQNKQMLSGGGLTKLVSIGVLVFTSSTVFMTLQNGLNNIWKVKLKPGNNFKSIILNRLISFALVVGLGALLLFSLGLDAILSFMHLDAFFELFEVTVFQVKITNTIMSLSITTLAILVIFKVLPGVRLRWLDVLPGAVLTMGLLVVGKYGINIYVGNNELGSVYGAAGSFVILLIWVYYSAIILYMGAQFTFEYVMESGRKVEPYNHMCVVSETIYDSYDGLYDFYDSDDDNKY